MTSRQQKWQSDKLKKGLCKICGKRKLHKGHSCRACYEKHREATKANYKKSPEAYLLASEKWRKKNPSYLHKYYLKNWTKIRKRHKKYYEKHRLEIRKRQKEYYKKRKS